MPPKGKLVPRDEWPVPGSACTRGERDAALLLANTYVVECERWRAFRRDGTASAGHRPVTFVATFGELPGRESKRVEDNIEDRPTRPVTSLWVRLARKVIARKIEPADFVRRYFNSRVPDMPVPLPEMLLSENAFEIYPLLK